MTNNDIILKAVQTTFAADPEKLKLQYHTFAVWKQLGFSVKKGEHAALCLYLWKYGTRKRGAADPAPAAGDDDENAEIGTGYFKTKAYLFSSDQVERK